MMSFGLSGSAPSEPGHARHAGLDHGLLGQYLVAHLADRFRARADEDEARLLDALGEIGILRQEAVTGMDRLGVGDFGGADDGRHVQVAQGGRRRPDAHRFFGQLDVFRLAVGFGMYDHGLDTHFAAGALDAQGNLAAVGNQYFFKHVRNDSGRCGTGRGKKPPDACRKRGEDASATRGAVTSR